MTTAHQTALLSAINRGLPDRAATRYSALRVKLEAETLTEQEHAELLGLTDELERLQVERLENLSQLAALRGVSVSKLIEDLRLSPAAHA